MRHRSWEEWYADAVMYHKEHGHLMVPQEYRTPNGDRLGIWIYGQRDRYMGRKKGYSLTPEQIEKLEAIQMVWDPLQIRGDEWEQMYQWVSQYYREHGKLPNWPRNLKAPDGRSMYGWINTQRTKLGEGKMPPSRRERLARIGINIPQSQTAPQAH